MAAADTDPSGMGNYEQLGSYAAAADHAAIRADAAAAVAARGAAAIYPRAGGAAAHTATDLDGGAGAYDWLRLYFDEVIWPEAQQARRTHSRYACACTCLHVHMYMYVYPSPDLLSSVQVRLRVEARRAAGEVRPQSVL